MHRQPIQHTRSGLRRACDVLITPTIEIKALAQACAVCSPKTKVNER
jgi:hypothetical protein